MKTLTKKTKKNVSESRQNRQEELLQQITAWRNTVGKKLKGWNEVKTIRNWRERM